MFSGAIRGNSGAPGELIGNFTSYETIGNILYNTDCGVFGTLNSSPTNFEEIPVAYKQEIRVGPATIYSTVEGQTPKEYEILIENMTFDRKYLIGRTKMDVPEMDGVVYIKNTFDKDLINEFIKCKIVDIREYDLIAEIV